MEVIIFTSLSYITTLRICRGVRKCDMSVMCDGQRDTLGGGTEGAVRE